MARIPFHHGWDERPLPKSIRSRCADGSMPLSFGLLRSTMRQGRAHRGRCSPRPAWRGIISSGGVPSVGSPCRETIALPFGERQRMQKAIGSGSHVSRSATGLGLIALAACLSASISLLIGYAGWGDSLRVAPAASVVLLGGAGLVWVVSAGLLFRDLRRALAAYAQATEVGHRLAGELKASRSVVRHTPGLTATFSADLELRELLGASTLEGQEARGKRLFRPADLALLQRTMANTKFARPTNGRRRSMRSKFVVGRSSAISSCTC